MNLRVVPIAPWRKPGLTQAAMPSRGITAASGCCASHETVARRDWTSTTSPAVSRAGANAKDTDGVAVFTMDEAGLMFEASIGGQQFTYPDRRLARGMRPEISQDAPLRRAVPVKSRRIYATRRPVKLK